jgi:hypothetical protein
VGVPPPYDGVPVVSKSAVHFDRWSILTAGVAVSFFTFGFVVMRDFIIIVDLDSDVMRDSLSDWIRML